jgi:hypothetical protein
MCCDSFEELLVQISPMRPVAVALNGEERLERFQRLDRALKADCSWPSRCGNLLKILRIDWRASMGGIEFNSET